MMNMPTPPIVQSLKYARAIADLVERMPVARAAEVYDFACFLQTRPTSTSPAIADDEGWLNDSEEQMQAEDALWDAAYARHHDRFAMLAETARAEIAAGATEPLFDNDGEPNL